MVIIALILSILSFIGVLVLLGLSYASYKDYEDLRVTVERNRGAFLVGQLDLRQVLSGDIERQKQALSLLALEVYKKNSPFKETEVTKPNRFDQIDED